MRVKSKSKTTSRNPRGRKRDAAFSFRKRVCRFCVNKIKSIDYKKDTKALESFIKERGKIVSRRFSGNCAKHQRMVAEGIKRARFLALIPYTRA